MQIKQELDMANQQTNTIRLDRIEEKIDRLTDAMVSIARAEEKINGLQDDHDKMYERINRLSTKLDEIASKVDENSRTVEFIHKLFWVCIVSIAGAIAANVWMIN